MHRSSRLILPMLLGAGLLVDGCRPAPGPASKTDAEGLPITEEATIAGRVDQLQLVAQGINKELTYKAPQFGQIILFDQVTGEFIYHGRVAKSESFVFEPASSRAQINKQTIDLDHVTNERDEYRLYFVPQ